MSDKTQKLMFLRFALDDIHHCKLKQPPQSGATLRRHSPKEETEMNKLEVSFTRLHIAS